MSRTDRPVLERLPTLVGTDNVLTKRIAGVFFSFFLVAHVVCGRTGFPVHLNVETISGLTYNL